MSEVLKPDICVIGAGPAGLTVATAAATLGVPVVLVERGRMGGSHLHVGSIPSKVLVAAAGRAAALADAGAFGVKADGMRVDFPAMMAHMRETIATLEPNASAERLAGLGVNVIRGEASFSDPRTLRVGATTVRARRFVVATGARPAIPTIPNLLTVPYLTTDTLSDLNRLPGHLIIVGGGRAGIEFAQAFRRLGSAVTVLEAERALAAEDPELAALLVETLRGEGIDICEGARIARVARRGRSGVRVTLESAGGRPVQVDATHLLIAAGRRPDLLDLGLERAGVGFDERGIRVNRRLRSSNGRIYAVGDVLGGPCFAHLAVHQAELVVRSMLFRFGGRVRPEILSWATFTDPALAHVGLSEAEARRRHGRVQVLRWPFSENERAQVDRATRGLVKVLVTRRGRVLGADMLSRDAGELIAPFALAVASGLDVQALAAAVFPSPTRAEAARRAALAFYAPKLQSPVLGRMIELLRKLG